MTVTDRELQLKVDYHKLRRERGYPYEEKICPLVSWLKFFFQ